MCIYIYICMYVYMYVGMYACMYVCMYVCTCLLCVGGLCCVLRFQGVGLFGKVRHANRR